MSATLTPTAVKPTTASREQSGTPVARGSRISSVDYLRGLVMIVMVLDHTRDYFHHDSYLIDPTDLAKTYPALFLTRWVTHFCAPVFMFLAGVGAALQRVRGKPVAEVSRFLWTRGVWLVVLELTVVRLAMSFGFYVRGIFYVSTQVIWALGLSMIVLALCVRLPLRIIALGAGLMVGLHNLLDGIRIAPWAGPGTPYPSLGGMLWMVLHQPGRFPLWDDGVRMIVQYPLVPWCAVMALGYVAGHVYAWDETRRRRVLLRVGLALCAAFVVIRASNLYGDAAPWSGQPTALFTAFSFVNTTKYPPSLLFLLMTLGPALIALAWLEPRADRFPSTRLAAIVVTVGRVPLFFYLMQWLVPNTMFTVASIVTGKAWRNFQDADMATVAFSLPVTYAAWAVSLVIIYPMCRWYASVKQRHPEWTLLSYL